MPEKLFSIQGSIEHSVTGPPHDTYARHMALSKFEKVFPVTVLESVDRDKAISVPSPRKVLSFVSCYLENIYIIFKSHDQNDICHHHGYSF